MMIEGREYEHLTERNVVKKQQVMRRRSSKVRERDLSSTIGNFTPDVLDKTKKEVA